MCLSAHTIATCLPGVILNADLSRAVRYYVRCIISYRIAYRSLGFIISLFHYLLQWRLFHERMYRVIETNGKYDRDISHNYIRDIKRVPTTRALSLLRLTIDINVNMQCLTY